MSLPPALEKSVPLWGFLLTVLGAIFTAAMVTGATFERLDHLERQQGNLSTVKEDVRELKTDVKWIRERLK